MILILLSLLLIPLVLHCIDGQALLWFNFIFWYAGLIAPSFILNTIGLSWSSSRVLSLLLFSFPLYLLGNFFSVPLHWSYWLIICVLGVILCLFKKSNVTKLEFIKLEIFFLTVFNIFLVINAFHPALYWGEKPMDISTLGYFLKMTIGPIIDPWAYGTKLQYYSLGYFSWSWPAKLAMMGLEQAYVYSIAGVAAMSAFAANEFYQFFSKKHSRFLSVLFIFIGTLGVLNSLSQDSVFGSLGAFWSATRIFSFNHFAEFPLWSFVFSDLHPHMMAYPLLILVFSSLIKAIKIKPENDQLVIASLSLILLPWLNAWDFLVMMGLASFILLSYTKEIFTKKYIVATLLICVSGLSAFSFLSSASRTSTFGLAPTAGLFGLILHFLLPILAISFVSLRLKNIRMWIVSGYLILLVIIVDNIIFMDRVNTVFKFMTTLGICLSLFIPVVPLLLKGKARLMSQLTIGIMILLNLLLIPMIISSKPFPVKIPSLQGFSFLKYSLPSDSKIIEFLNQQDRLSLILEYPGNSFNYQASRISAFTGHPLWLGWDNHVVLRGKTWKTVLERKQWIDGMYKSTDALMVHSQLISKGIQYLIVGPTEQEHYEGVGLDKFTQYPELFKPVISHLSSTLFEVISQ